MMPWRLLIHDPLPPPLALAVDEAIALRCADQGNRSTLRFYQWDRPAISIGRFQSIDRAVRAEACRDAAIPVLRRITGGRAVWHDCEVTYSLVTPLPSSLFPPSLSHTVTAIGRALAVGLQQFGLPVQIPSTSPGPFHRRAASQSSFCFAEPAWYEVRIRGKKIIGSAQRRWRDRFLQQGSILLRHDPQAVARWLPVDSDDLQAAAGLEDFLTTPVAADRLARLLARSLASTWNIELEPGSLTAEETALAESLARDKYGDDAWTMKEVTSRPARSRPQ